MPSPRPRPRRGHAVLVLLAAIATGLALARARSEVGGASGLGPTGAALVVAGQWTLWLLADYVVAVVALAAAIVAVGRPRRERRLARLVPAMLRPALGAFLGVALTSSPAAAASSPPPPTASGPLLTADPFDWSAPPDAVGAVDAAVGHAIAGTISAPGRAPPQRLATRTVRVRAGDCLWSLAARDLAARHLGSRPADVAVAWRRWYAANRAAIGPDPGLLRPGEILRAPSPGPPLHPSNPIARSHP